MAKMPRAVRRAATWGGVVGPVAFVGAWLVAGARTPHYSLIDSAISRLAATHAPYRALMTSGFVAFGIAVPAFAVAARDRLGAKAATAAAISGLATLGVAAAPLDVSDRVDLLHGTFATLGYITLAAVPGLARPVLRASGYRRLTLVAPFVTAVSAVSLAATVLGPAHGLFQRVGLTATDTWLVATALVLVWSGARWEQSRAG